MSIHYEIQILRSKLIALMRSTQRTVDYSIKAMQLGRPELCRVVRNSRDETSAIRCWIKSHGQELLAADIAEAVDSRFVCAALRISEALGVAHDAAFEIAQQSEIRFAAGWIPVSAELEDAGQFVNSLLRLCVLSLLKRDARHAKTVLHNDGAGESLDLAVHLTHHNRTHLTSAQARFELAIMRCLEGIAGQTREIADSILLWLEEIERGKNAAPRGEVHKPAHHTARLARRALPVPVSAPDLPHKALFFGGAIPPRGLGDAVPIEDFAPARLMRLQQRVCELLVKNQQLRMALMAEKADRHHDRLC